MVRRYRFEGIAFITGFGLMAYELAAARILAPSIGSSTYVWTGVIGVIIAALSLGYYAGGRVADARARISDIASLLLLASVMTAATLVFYESTLTTIVDTIDDSRIQAVMAAFLLFAPASFFMGMVSPYLAKLNVRSLTHSGRSVASLSAFNSLGGIVGTFVTGFVLFGYIGSRETVAIVTILLVASSWSLVPRLWFMYRFVLSLLIIIVAVAPASHVAGITSIDTPSAHYKVIDTLYEDRMVTGLVTGPRGTQSAVFQSGVSDPVFWYTQEMAHLTISYQPKRILMLGGGAFTLPQHLSEQLPNAQIDVVEIDPELHAISKKYFNYQDPKNIRLIFDDARIYVNRATAGYDVILVDVYGDTSIPFTFMTKEYGENIARLLKHDGVVVINLIAGTKGPCKEVFSAVDAAYRHQLPHGIFANQPGSTEARANNVVVYSRQPLEVKGYLPVPLSLQAAYTDNHVPAERLHYACQTQ